MNGYKRYKGACAPDAAVFFELGEGDLEFLPEAGLPPFEETEEDDEVRLIMGGASVVEEEEAPEGVEEVNLDNSLSSPTKPLVCNPLSKSENSLLETGCSRSSFSRSDL